MSKYRNRYFLLGILLLLLGVQFRMVDSFVLNEPATRVLAKVTRTKVVANNSVWGSILTSITPAPKKQVTPPRWFGLVMITIGSVVCFHALAIPRYRGE